MTADRLNPTHQCCSRNRDFNLTPLFLPPPFLSGHSDFLQNHDPRVHSLEHLGNDVFLREIARRTRSITSPKYSFDSGLEPYVHPQPLNSYRRLHEPYRLYQLMEETTQDVKDLVGDDHGSSSASTLSCGKIARGRTRDDLNLSSCVSRPPCEQNSAIPGL